MIVVDASAMVEALVGRDVDEELLNALAGEVSAPHLLDVEVLSVLRGLTLGRTLEAAVAEVALVDYFDLSISRAETAPLAERIWQLRHQHTSYDASYIALAEALSAPLYTCDTKLGSGRHEAPLRVMPRTH